MGAHEGVGLLGRVALSHRVLDARPEFFLYPVTGHQHLDAGEAKVAFLQVGGGIAALQGAHCIETEVRKEPSVRDEDLGLPARLVWHVATIRQPVVPYAAHVPVLKTLHVLGAIFLLGGVSTHALLRPMAARAADVAQHALYQFAWRVQLALVYTGLALVLITGLLMWVGRFKLFTGWLLLGFLLYVAAAGLDGAFLAPNLRRARNAAADGSTSLAAAAMTIQLVAWLLLVVVVFLMVAQPF